MTVQPMPRVSVIVANYNGEAFLEAALESALNQTLDAVEVIFVDDASSDGSLTRARAIAEKDDRLKVIALAENGGPSRARNVALEEARGEWVAVLDSDDLMHPRRLEWLLDHAEAAAADIVADDLLVFYSDAGAPPHTFIGEGVTQPFYVGTADYIRSNRVSGNRDVNYGFLKPVIRRTLMEQHAIRYNESLDNSEDYELIVQLLLKGARYSVLPVLGYFYRKHSRSISHRFGRQSLLAILRADEAIARQMPDSPDLRRVLTQHQASVHKAIALLDVVEALKSKRPGRIFGQLLKDPRSFLLLRSIVSDRWQRRRSRAAVMATAPCPAGATVVLFGDPSSEVSRRRHLGVFGMPAAEGWVDNICPLDLTFSEKGAILDKRSAVMVASACVAGPASLIANDTTAAAAFPYAFQCSARRNLLMGDDARAVKVEPDVRVLSPEELSSLVA